MKTKIKNIFWSMFSFLAGLLILWLLKPELIVRFVETKEYTDLSAAHGIGYRQEGNTFTVTEEESWYLFDVEQLDEDYGAVDLHFDPAGFTCDREVLVTLYISDTGLQENEQAVHQILHPEDQKLRFKGDFGKKNFLRIAVHAPVGESYVLSAIAIEQKRISLTALATVLLTGLTALLYGLVHSLKLRTACFRLLRWIHKKWDFLLECTVRQWEKKNDFSAALRKRLLFLFGSQLIILAVFIRQKALIYPLSDDITMIAISGGGYVTPSEYIINMHILIGCFLKKMFSIFPGINWVTVLYLSVYLFAAFCLDMILAEKESSKNTEYSIRFFGDLVVADIFFSLLIGYFSFTVAAYAAAIAGTACIVRGFDKNTEIQGFFKVCGIVLIAVSALIRAEVLKTVILVLLPLSLYELIRHKNIRYFVMEFLLGTIMSISILSNLSMLVRDPQEAKFFQWGELRSSALDCAPVPYNEELFAEKGISYAEYHACYNAFYYIKDAVSENVLQGLMELNHNSNKYNTDLIAFIQKHFSYLKNMTGYEALCQWIFAVLFLGNMFVGTKETRKKSILIYLGTVGTEFVYFLIQRSLYRVVMPTYILGSVLLLLSACCEQKKLEYIRNKNVSDKKIYLSGCALLVLAAIMLSLNSSPSEKAAYSKERKKALEYMKKHEDKLFLAGEPSVFSIGTCESVWNYAGRDGRWNLIGNWEIYSVPSNRLLESYGYHDPENIAYEAVNNDQILFLSARSPEFIKNSGWIIDLYEEYYGIRPRFEKVEDICIDLVNENTYESWASYRLIN